MLRFPDRCRHLYSTVPVFRDGWELVIGLETHVQISSNTKLFSRSPTNFDAPPNRNVSFTDAAFPGTLPIMNLDSIEKIVKLGIALGSDIQERSNFERKHYTYPDSPAGYQLTQCTNPIVKHGFMELGVFDGLLSPRRIRIQQIQVEQDTGKSFHDSAQRQSFIDLNRAGSALAEIVTLPDLRSIEESQAFLSKLQLMLRMLRISDGNMEEGSLRCDANISVKPCGSSILGTRCEIKNLNSIRNLGRALAFEANRHIEILENHRVVEKETRGFDEASCSTFRMRSKETSIEYSYMPDPDLPDIIIDMSFIDKIRKMMPELPDSICKRLAENYGLNAEQVRFLIKKEKILEYFEEVMELVDQKRDPHTVYNWIVTEYVGLLHRSGEKDFSKSKILPKQMAELVSLVDSNVISSKIGKNVLSMMYTGNRQMPTTIVANDQLESIADEIYLRSICREIIECHSESAEKAKSGKKRVLSWLVGEAMKKTRGKANPVIVSQIFSQLLSENDEA